MLLKPFVGFNSFTLGDFTWAAVWLLLAALLGWSLWRQLRAPSPKELKPTNGF